ncbi:MAG: lipopolysaccharide biosynthesis protein [Cyclonatronaceae bacterium]
MRSNEPVQSSLFAELKRKAGAVSATRLISVGAALIVAMILTRLLDEDLYGAYRKLWLIYAMFGTILTSTVIGTLYYRSGTASKRGEAAGVALMLSMASGLLIALISWFGAGFWASILNAPGLEPGFRMFAPYLFFGIFAASAEPLFVIYHRKKWLVGYTGVYNLIEAVLIVIPFAMGMTIERVVMIMSAGPALRSVAVILFAARHGVSLPRLSVLKREFRPSVAYATGIFMVSVAGIAAMEADKWIVGIFFESDALYAIYVVGAKKLPFVGAVTSAIAAGVVAQYSSLIRGGSYKEALYACRKAAAILLFILLPMIAVSWVLAEEILVFLFEKYADSAPVFRIYLFVLLSNIVLVSSFVLAHGHSRINALTGLAELVVNVLLSILLIRLIGIEGPAWATLIAHLTYTIILLMYCKIRLGISPFYFLPERDTWPVVPVTVLVFALALLIRNMTDDVIMAVVAGGIVTALAILFLLWKAR